MLPITSILVPIDFSQHSQQALIYAKEWAKQWSATLHLIHVIEPVIFPVDWGYTPVDLSDVEKEYQQTAENELTKINESLHNDGYSAIPQVLHGGRSSDEIIQYAKDHGISMICIATNGRGGVEHLLLGSTTERVVRKAPCPVLVIRPTTTS
ncbi:MAG: universal stress protein [Candidatus Kapaibacteriota bacterium]